MMIKHYLKVAFRNLAKYKVQSIVSILGLAVGFVCFALSTLWIRYEMTYDTFHEGAERIYLVRAHYAHEPGKISNSTPYPLADYLQKGNPEIEAMASTSVQKVKFRVKDTEKDVVSATADSVLMNFFNIRVLRGTVNFLKGTNGEIAITEEFSKRIFGEEEALGREVEVSGHASKVGAIVSGWSSHSNIPYSILTSARHYTQWGSANENLFVRIRKGTNGEEFQKKIAALRINDIEKENELGELLLTPLSALRYSGYVSREDTVITFSYILYFSLAGGLVIICSLFNYLTLYISRLYMRRREMALRKVNGAGNKDLFVQLTVELLIVQFIALVAGLFFIEICMSRFLEFTRIAPNSYYGEILVYLFIVIALSLLLAQIPLYHFRRRTLQAAVKGKVSVNRPYAFRKFGIVIQLIVSLVFIFCTVVIMKQIYFLKHTDLGMERHNIANVALWRGDIKQWGGKIAALPMVTEVLPPRYFPIIPTGPMMYAEMNHWEDMPEAVEEPITIGIMPAMKDFFDFYDLKLIEGELLSEKNAPNDIVIDENTLRIFGWNQGVGKTLGYEKDGKILHSYRVVRNFCYQPPTSIPGCIALQQPQAQNYLLFRASILFKFEEGSWHECRKAIEVMHKEDFPNAYLRLFNEEEEYDKYLRSESALMKLLTFVSLVCILISLFGIFSLVTLSCEQRRKEIAIRRVNGAQVYHILHLFFREYLLLLATAVIIAFPIGYVLMKLWIDRYVRQTPIEVWIYVAIFGIIGFFILLCIGCRVWKAVLQNPAEIIKNE